MAAGDLGWWWQRELDVGDVLYGASASPLDLFSKQC